MEKREECHIDSYLVNRERYLNRLGLSRGKIEKGLMLWRNMGQEIWSREGDTHKQAIEVKLRETKYNRRDKEVKETPRYLT